MRQTWTDLTFLHWSYPAILVAPLLPRGLELDLFDGKAWVGLVPFNIERLVFRDGAKAPWIPAFPETNVRTYVTGPGGKRAVWFFSLDAASLGAVLGARITYGLPYFWSRMKVERVGPGVHYTSHRLLGGPGDADITVAPSKTPVPASELATFLTARYRLYSWFLGNLFTAEIVHEPWPLRYAEVESLRENLVTAAGLPAPEGAPLVHFSKALDVRVGRLQRATS